VTAKLYAVAASHPCAAVEAALRRKQVPYRTFAVRASAPSIARLSGLLNGASDDAVRADLAALPAHLDRIEGWIAEGVIGGPEPTGADLQIGASLALLLTLGDVAPLIEGRPAAELARRQFADFPGHAPAGLLPVDWLPSR
jgi:glutathione S-transferase